MIDDDSHDDSSRSLSEAIMSGLVAFDGPNGAGNAAVVALECLDADAATRNSA